VPTALTFCSNGDRFRKLRRLKARGLTVMIRNIGKTATRERIMRKRYSLKMLTRLRAHLMLACALLPLLAQAQTQTYSPVVLAPPRVDRVDDNYVSIITGKTQFSIPALRMGDVSFTPYSANGSYFQVGGQILDNNYGRIADCQGVNGSSYATAVECSSGLASNGIQTIYGEERETFGYANGLYSSQGLDGATFVDNGSTCTWTQHDGTQIVYAAYHNSGNPICQSNNILKVIRPNGLIFTYYYYGAFSTSYGTQTPIVSVVTNSGYMLKYSYSGTPVAGEEASVTAINRAFQACDPSALSCTLSQAWPTATLSFVAEELTSNCDNFPSLGTGYDPCRHYTFTVQDQAQRQYVFGLDSYSRVISYQPPGATSPVYYYTLCSLHSNNTLTNCWSYTTWPPAANGWGDLEPMVFDWVYSVTRHDPSQPNGPNGPTWSYNYNFYLGSPPGFSEWEHDAGSPLGPVMIGKGNATPGTEESYGPTGSITLDDGTVAVFESNTRNDLATMTTPAGVEVAYDYDMNGSTQRGNLWKKVESGPGTSTAIVESSTYPTSCANIDSCNEPTSVTDANGNTSTFTYDSRGEVLTVTGPAVNGVQPQTRYTYAPYYAWYLSSSGAMAEDPNPIWLRASESYCMKGAPSGSGCALPNDEVLTTYDYGPESGPNNLLLRGKTVTSEGETLRTCYTHDPQGDKISETSPNANPSSCSSY
jgi:YD repeat-containing protein